jgi:hypothetical protein
MERQVVAPVFGHTGSKTTMRVDEQQHFTKPPNARSYIHRASIRGRHIEVDGADLDGNVTIGKGDYITANVKNLRVRNTKSLFEGKNQLIRMENVISEKGEKLL